MGKVVPGGPESMGVASLAVVSVDLSLLQALPEIEKTATAASTNNRVRVMGL